MPSTDFIVYLLMVINQLIMIALIIYGNLEHPEVTISPANLGSRYIYLPYVGRSTFS